jgi:hypothetical protein
VLLSSDAALSDDKLLHWIRWVNQFTDTDTLITPATASEWLEKLKAKNGAYLSLCHHAAARWPLYLEN